VSLFTETEVFALWAVGQTAPLLDRVVLMVVCFWHQSLQTKSGTLHSPKGKRPQEISPPPDGIRKKAEAPGAAGDSARTNSNHQTASSNNNNNNNNNSIQQQRIERSQIRVLKEDSQSSKEQKLKTHQKDLQKVSK